MKKLYTLLSVVFIAAGVFAQTPDKMSYQAVIRNSNNQLVTNQEVGMQISILQGSANGTAVYVETQTPNTNANGLVSIEIGNGSVVSGNFAAIDWANGPYFIQSETDPTGGINYTITGTSQLLSVPYALHAKTAESIAGELSEIDPVFSAWDKNYNDLANKPDLANVATSGNYSDLTNQPNIPEVYNSTVTFTGTAVGSSPQTVRLNQSTNKTITINQAEVSGFISTETDPVFTNSEAANITATDITNLSNLSGVNTGDQDLSPLATKTALSDSTAKVRSEIPDISGFITTETDPVFTNSEAAKITVADITNLSNLSGTNTGDQDLTPLATKTALADSTTKVRSEIPDVSGFLSSESDPFWLADSSVIRAEIRTEISDSLSIFNSELLTVLQDTAAQIRGDIPDVSGFITAETDPSVPSGTQPGEMQYWNGTKWITIASGSEGQLLTFSNGTPKWVYRVPSTPNVTSLTGRIWMDRNLGASRVATSINDAEAYGDLYQWGRGADGHEKRTSGTTSTLSASDTPGHDKFIIITSFSLGSTYDWHSPKNDNLWQGENGINNPCPLGYRLPTLAEWEAERLSWSSNNIAGAFASALKLPAAGMRDINGLIQEEGFYGDYWSSTVVGDNALDMYIPDYSASIQNGPRVWGYSVRCIKN